MLIQSLCEYFDNYYSEAADIKIGFSSFPVTHKIMLNLYGDIVDIIDIRQVVTEKNKRKFNPVNVVLPASRVRTTNIISYPLDCNIKYALGVSVDTSPITVLDDDLVCRFEEYKSKNLKFIQGMDEPLVNAYRSFLEKWSIETFQLTECMSKLNKDVKGVIFALDGDPAHMLHTLDCIKARVLECTEENQVDFEKLPPRCIDSITGKEGYVACVHNKIKGSNFNGNLVGVNNKTAESYNKKQGNIAGITLPVMEKYTKVLNYLMDFSNKHVFRLGDLFVIYFKPTASCSSDITDMFVNTVMNVPDDVNDSDLTALMNCIRTGSPFDSTSFKDVDYVVCGLKYTDKYRLSVQFFYRNSFDIILNNILQHHRDMFYRLGDESVIFKSLYQLVSLVSYKGKDDNKDNKSGMDDYLYTELFKSVFYNTAYPRMLLENAVRKIRTNILKGKVEVEGKNKRYYISSKFIALLRGYLNRSNRLNGKEEEIKLELNTSNMNKGYLCGRLFAIYEMLQYCVQKDTIDTTIRDRFYTLTMDTPFRAFVQIEKLSVPYMHDLRNNVKGLAIKFEKSIAEVISKLETYPKSLSLEDQGNFICGYYQQRQYEFEQIVDKKANNDDVLVISSNSVTSDDEELITDF